MPDRPTILTVKDLWKTYGDREVLRGLSFWIYDGARIGIIGRNGEGKSTFARIMGGLEPPSSGEIIPKPGLTFGILEQEPYLDPAKTVSECLEEAVADTRALVDRFNALNDKLATELEPDEMQEALDDLEKVQAEIDAKEAWELDHRIEKACEALRLPPRDAKVSHLSGGERRRVALCRVLMKHPDLLVLDEPTNHLDAESVDWLEQYLKDYRGTYILVTHDRYFLDNVVNWMVEVDRGRLHIYEGNYSTYLEKKAIELDIEERTQTHRAKVLRGELAWLHSNPQARTTKSRARLKNYQKLVEEQEAYDERQGSATIRLPFGERLGDKVVVVEGLAKAYGGRTLFNDLSFDLPRAGIVGIVGANGVGKTTLVRILMGLDKPDAGKVKVGDTVHFCYVDQGRETLDPERTVYEEVSGGAEFLDIGKKRMSMRAYCSQFLFRGSIQQTPVGKLSGGERNRLQLAKLLRAGGNVIVLDEPTNDLDLDTLRVLEEALLEFPGCAVVITHDRYFLNRIATHILAFEGGGRACWFEGNYELYQARKRERDLEAGRVEASKKSKYRKL